MDKIKNRLSYQLLFSTFLSIAFGVGVYLLAQLVGSFIIDTYLTSEATRDRRLQESAQSLQEFVDTNHVSQSDKALLDSWVDGEGYLMLQIYSKGMIMYDSTMDVDMSVLEMAGGDTIQWQKTFPISFADGTGDAMFYEYYSMRDELFSTIAAVAFGVLAFVITLILLVRRKTKYITQLSHEIHILEGGDLEYPISVQGSDEISDLAQSIDDMRVALMNRQKTEDHIQQKNYELVTSMSHDLRSPLTSLIGYLDILEMKKYQSEEDREQYLSKSRSKAYRIKEISDDLFEYSFSNGAKKDTTLLKERDCAEFLNDTILETIFELEAAGFSHKYEPPNRIDSVSILINQSLIERAFDNLISNVKKYADQAYPIHISYLQTDQNTIEFSISNTVCDSSEAPSGSGIGLQTVKRAMEIHGWDLTINHEMQCFTVVIGIKTDGKLITE